MNALREVYALVLGAAYHVDVPAVSDQHVITASGLAAVDFARAIFAELSVFSASDEAALL